MPPWISSMSTVVLVAVMAGCTARPDAPPEPAPAAPADEPAPIDPERDEPQFESVQDEVDYYIDRLPDRSFIDTYGGEGHERPWYIAAERLGQIGGPAIPALVSRLDTEDEYELMLAVYALMLASQDPELMAATGGDYVELGTVLDPRHNDENRAIALAW